MSAKKKSSRRKPAKGRRREDLTLKLWFAGIFLVGFVLVGLLALGLLRQRYLAPPTAPVGGGEGMVVAPPPPAAGADWNEVLALLAARGWTGKGPLPDPAGGKFYRVDRPLPTPVELERLAVELKGLPGLSAETQSGRGLQLTRGDGSRLLLLFAAPPAVSGKGGKLSIIVDDLGREMGAMHQLLALDLPLTLSILPGEPHAREAASAAHKQGREVLIHIPMEPQGYPAINPGNDALFVNASPEELRQRFRHYRQEVPYAVGGNNHMGSRFTEDPAGMAVVLGEMRQAGLFFVDSRTTGASVAYELARRAGIPVARRDMFLDNVQDEAKIGIEIDKLIRLAHKQGYAIGICHPHPATLAALRRAVPELRSAGLELVPVSRLVKVPQGPQ